MYSSWLYILLRPSGSPLRWVSGTKKSTTNAVAACAVPMLVLRWTEGVNRGNRKNGGLHSGFCSSHFFFRLRHVKQPVLVRLLKFRFRFLGSCWMTESDLCSFP